MGYTETLQKLYRRNEFSIKLGLQNIRRLLELLGNPQQRFPAVHIAGTNGKGSVAAFTASVLQEAGTRTGLYTSPHLIDFRERIRVNGRLISRKQVLAGLTRIERLIRKESRRRKNFSPTYFEIVTALAMDYFAKEKVEIAVLETGLGGRLDATNVCRPAVTVITHIDWDHQELLGNSLAAIAAEKAGIIKPRIPLVTCERKKQVLRVLKQEAGRKKAPLIQVLSQVKDSANGSLKEEVFDYQGKLWRLPNLKIKLLGRHQIENAATSLRVLEELAQQGFAFSQEAVRRGFEKARWPGRFQVIKRNPPIILDGAHNPEGIQILLSVLKKKKIRKPVFIFGMMKDKEIGKAARLLGKAGKIFYLVQAKVPRAASLAALEEQLKKANPRGKFYPVGDMAQAIRLARRRHRGNGSALCVCGSLYLVGETLKILGAHEN